LKRTLLVVGGGIEAVPGIKKAGEMGLHVVVSDQDPNAPGAIAADDFLTASSYDIAATVSEAKKYHRSVRPIDGVICIASDVPLTVAEVAKALDLPGIPLSAARLSMDKLAMKDQFFAHNLAVPWYSPVESFAHLREIVNEAGYPLVLKPVDSRGARGVLRILPGLDLKWAYERALDNSPTSRVMVERYLSGPQVSTESIVLNGRAYTLGFSDRNYEYLERYAPYIVENGGELPSFLPQETQQAVCELVEKAALTMGITEGVVKGDIVVHDGLPHVIELAARLSGGYFCTHEIPLNTGVDFVRQAILLSLGEKPNPADLEPRFNRGVGQRYLFPEPGRVINILGVEDVSKRPDVALCEIRVKAGDIIEPIENHPGRPGVVIATASTREEAVAIAIEAVNEIKIVTERVD